MGVNTAMEDVRMVCVCAHELEEGGREGGRREEEEDGEAGREVGERGQDSDSSSGDDCL